MFIKAGFHDDFTTLMMHLEAKYGKEMFDLDGIGKQKDINEFSKTFFTSKSNVADVSIDSNANVDSRDMISYNVELPKAMFRLNAYYLLWKKMSQLYGRDEANRIIEMQLSGDIYINDFHGIQMPYCYNYSTLDIALEGLPMVHKIKSVAPKYLISFKSQLEQFVNIASNSTLGATGVADMFIVMSYYIDRIFEQGHDAGVFFDGWFSDEEKGQIEELLTKIPESAINNQDEIDKITKTINNKINKNSPANKKLFTFNVWKYVAENLVSFIYTINQPFRGGLQSAFTNVSIFDDVFLNKLVPDYKIMKNGNVYTPEIKTVKKVQELFIDIMNRELRRTTVTFAVTTACFAVDEDKNGKRVIKDNKFKRFIAEKDLEWGFINIYSGKSSSLSSCCRLRSDLSELSELNTNFIGGGSTKIGSLGVVTCNMARLAWQSKDKDDFIEKLKVMVDDVGKINNAKRHIIKKRIEKNTMPLYTLGFINLQQQFLTFGVNGLYECLQILGLDIQEKEGEEFALKIIQTINDVNDQLQKKYKTVFNCEQTPSENSAIKLAKKDKLLKINDGRYELYSNQFIPLTTDANLLDRIRLQGVFDSHFSGGSIMHANIEQRLDSVEEMERLIDLCVSKGVIYWAVNYNLQECTNGHITVSKGTNCSVCNEPIVYNYTRVVGFLTKTASWAKERRENDYEYRQFYNGDKYDIKPLRKAA